MQNWQETHTWLPLFSFSFSLALALALIIFLCVVSFASRILCSRNIQLRFQWSFFFSRSNRCFLHSFYDWNSSFEVHNMINNQPTFSHRFEIFETHSMLQKRKIDELFQLSKFANSFASLRVNLVDKISVRPWKLMEYAKCVQNERGSKPTPHFQSTRAQRRKKNQTDRKLKHDLMKFLFAKSSKIIKCKRISSYFFRSANEWTGFGWNVMRNSGKCKNTGEKKVKILYHYSARFHYRFPFYNFRHHTYGN